MDSNEDIKYLMNSLERELDIEEIEGIEVIQEGDWLSEHKIEIQKNIIKYNDRFYCIQLARSGSYWTDYDYLEPTVYEVVPKEVTTTVYERVK